MSLITPEVRSQIEDINLAELAISGGIFDGPAKEVRPTELEAQMSEPSFLDAPECIQKDFGSPIELAKRVNPVKAHAELEDLVAMLELVDESSNDPEAEAYEQEVIDALVDWPGSTSWSSRPF